MDIGKIALILAVAALLGAAAFAVELSGTGTVTSSPSCEVGGVGCTGVALLCDAGSTGCDGSTGGP